MEYFQMIERWTNKDIWDQECATYSGFCQSVGAPDIIIPYEYYINKIVDPIHTRVSTLLKVYL